ncbi:type II toxin-antitoxin system CcdA family antitoxin [Polymorphobacter multimanifer]|uniref:Antitoxin CcdA n=1 Tax=Polymorphobacter multimanifer TaxID=1070431 RepID=A0A841LBH6_9SPHN|nr:type II toxin-antitoxin system CcdA family antitoxin [Polymorphobacter multimanifer]MBB6229486.1 antitoxin CcdA [Polymorphobacter multimanifer]
MKRASVRTATRRPTNVSIDRRLVEDARALGINLSEACERGIADQVAATRAELWLAENREAIDSSNAHVEAHGLPLARYRLF